MSTPQPTRRIAIIGAGICGILAIKACKEEEHLFSEIVCFERTQHPGGLWMYREFEDEVDVNENENITSSNYSNVRRKEVKVKSNVVTVMKGTIANSSKELGALSDFPPDPLAPNFMHHREMLKYILAYAEHFDCLKHIRFDREVLKVTRVGSRVSILVKDHSNKSDKTVNEVFDTVLIASGHHGRPLIPTFEGQSAFKGKIVHTHHYKRPDEFEDKKVLIVGAGNSGLDVAVEVSSLAEKVYLSVRSGCWVLPRLGFRGGRPLDTSSLSRLMQLFKDNFKPSVVSFVIETILNRRFDHELFGLRPAHPILTEHSIINDQIASQILCGMVQVRGDIESITESGVIFKGQKGHNSTEVTQVDSIILATGFHIEYPFLSPELESQIVSEDSFNLYKYTFPIADFDNETSDNSDVKIAFIGLPNALGPLFPIAEIQSRWVVQVIKGACKLPSKSDMKMHLEKQEKIRKRKFIHRPRHLVEVEFIPYLDDIASEFGAKVNMGKLLRSDFKLWKKLFFGPALPYQYRLTGPHSWPKARDAILGADERIDAPLKLSFRTRKLTFNTNDNLYNPRYWDHCTIYTLFYGVIVVTLLDMMNLWY